MIDDDLGGRPRPSRSALVVIAALTGLAPLSIDFYVPGLPAMIRDLHTSASIGQLTITACLLGIAVSQVLAGSISDSLGRRKLVLFGLMTYAVSSVLCAVAPDVWILIVLRFLQGAACGVGFVISRAIVRDLFSGVELTRIFGRLLLISGVAPILAPVLGGQVLLVTGWRGVFLVLTAIAALLLGLAFRRLPETLADHLRHEPGLGTKLRVFGALLGDRSFLAYSVSGSLCFGAMFAYISGSSFVLEDTYSLSPQLFGIVFGINSVGIVFLGQVSGRLVDRLGARRLLDIGVWTMALGGVGLLVSIVLDGGLAPILVSLVVTISAIGLIFPNATALTLADQPHAAGSAAALFGVSQFGLGAVTAPLVGVAGSHTALPMGIVIATCGVAALIVLRSLAPG